MKALAYGYLAAVHIGLLVTLVLVGPNRKECLVLLAVVFGIVGVSWVGTLASDYVSKPEN